MEFMPLKEGVDYAGIIYVQQKFKSFKDRIKGDLRPVYQAPANGNTPGPLCYDTAELVLRLQLTQDGRRLMLCDHLDKSYRHAERLKQLEADFATAMLIQLKRARRAQTVERMERSFSHCRSSLFFLQPQLAERVKRLGTALDEVNKVLAEDGPEFETHVDRLIGWLMIGADLAANAEIFIHQCRHRAEAAAALLSDFEPLNRTQRKEYQRPELEHYKTVLALAAEAAPAITAARQMLQDKKRELYGHIDMTHSVWAEYQQERAEAGFMFLEDAPGQPKVRRPMFASW